MTRKPLGEGGFTYIAALVAVIILGITLGASGTYWATRMKRERETELVFRGRQIRDAMRRWYKADAPVAPGQPPPQPPPLTDLKQLLKDPFSTSKARYLRKLYTDPMTGKEWGVIKDQNQRIIGVASTSEEEPLKQGNFPDDLEPSDFEGKKKYSEWQFIYNRVPKPGTGTTVTGLGGTSNPNPTAPPKPK